MPHIRRPDGYPHQGLPSLLRLFERMSKTTQKYQYPPFAGTSDSLVSLLDSSSSESSNSLALTALAFLVAVASFSSLLSLLSDKDKGEVSPSSPSQSPTLRGLFPCCPSFPNYHIRTKNHPYNEYLSYLLPNFFQY